MCSVMLPLFLYGFSSLPQSLSLLSFSQSFSLVTNKYFLGKTFMTKGSSVHYFYQSIFNFSKQQTIYFLLILPTQGSHFYLLIRSLCKSQFYFTCIYHGLPPIHAHYSPLLPPTLLCHPLSSKTQATCCNYFSINVCTYTKYGVYM